jgi:hypothetical protein
VAWPLIAAPPSFALAASIAATPLVKIRPGRMGQGSAAAPETWCAEDTEARSRLIVPVLADHAYDVIDDTVDGEFRLALLDACVEGKHSLAWRIAADLAMLPSCFSADPATIPGSPPTGWQQAMVQVRGAANNVALLGLDTVPAPVAAIRTLRETIEDTALFAFDENGDALSDSPVPLHSDAAVFLARQAGEHGRLAVSIPVPAAPVDLYSQAQDLAASTGARVIAVAPCWGFCHRIGLADDEAGNAGWLGMGASLDEVDMGLAGFEQRA